MRLARKPLCPCLPGRIVWVTSPRAPAVRTFFASCAGDFPTCLDRVSGSSAGAWRGGGYIAALNTYSRKQLVDVILLARGGGGSIEDLGAFTEEIFARSDAACTLPVVSGGGPQAEFTSADFVADVRASRPPGGCLKIVVRARQEVQRHLRRAPHFTQISQQMR